MFWSVREGFKRTIFISRKNTFTLYETRRNVSELKRFYKDVTITQGEGGFEVNLDRKKLKTPLGKLLLIPNEGLALAVATEWDGQKDTIKRHTMHLTSLCNTAVDNPKHRDKAMVVDAILEFLETDTVLYHVDEPEDLVKLQRTNWDPLISFVNKKHHTHIAPTTGIGAPDVRDEDIEKFRKHLNSFNKWALTGYCECVESLKSLIVASCLLDRQVSVEQAVFLSRLESEYQTRKWGTVEWHHDVEMHDLRARVAAATLLVHSSIEEDKTVNKGHHNRPV